MPNQITYGPPANASNSAIPAGTPLGGPGSAMQGRGGALQVASAQAPTNPGYAQANMAQSLFNAYQLANAPAQQQIYNQIGDLQTQADLLGANYTTQSGYLNQSNQNQLAALGLQSQGTDIQQAANQRQGQLLTDQNALQQQQYGIAGQQLGLQGQGLDIQNAGLDINQKSLGIQGQGIAQQLADLYYGNDRAKQNLVAQKAAQGAGNSAGMGLGLQDLAQQLQSGASDLSRSQQQLGLQGDQLGLNRQQLGLNRQQLGLQQQGLGITQQQSALNFKEQQAANQDAAKQLDLVKQKTGLDTKEIENRTQQALDQLGLSTQLSTIDIYKAMADAQKGLYNPVQQVFGTLYQMTGLNPFMALGG